MLITHHLSELCTGYDFQVSGSSVVFHSSLRSLVFTPLPFSIAESIFQKCASPWSCVEHWQKGQWNVDAPFLPAYHLILPDNTTFFWVFQSLRFKEKCLSFSHYPALFCAFWLFLNRKIHVVYMSYLSIKKNLQEYLLHISNVHILLLPHISKNSRPTCINSLPSVSAC